jgi:predicted transcriptional regulator
MAKMKVTVTLDPELVARMKELAGNVSQYVEETMWEQVRHDALVRYLDDYEAKHGPIPEAAVERVRQVLSGQADDSPRGTLAA